MKMISDSFQTISPHFKEVHRLFSMKLQVDFGFSTDFGHVSIHPREVYPSYRYPKLIGKCKRPRKWTALEQYVFLDTKNLIKFQKWMKLDEFELARVFFRKKTLIWGRVWLRSLIDIIRFIFLVFPQKWFFSRYANHFFLNKSGFHVSTWPNPVSCKTSRL